MSVVAANAAAPKRLYNKTIKAHWTVQLETKGPDGTVYRRSMNVSGLVYVSSQGRLFIRGTRAVGRNSETISAGPGSKKYGESAATAMFRGNQLLGTVAAASGGAVRTTITFDPSFSNCTVDVVYGRGGAARARYPGINDPRKYEMISYQISNRGCSISEGNIFAN
ncbi:MAG: hypothetical protein J0H40_17160 [Rhizobiales bacterium]|nr:hypothetical protein [Hyphomicrobiales bacterium]